MLHLFAEILHLCPFLRAPHNEYIETTSLVEEANRIYQLQLAQFASELYHEISNPLTVISLNLELLKSHPLMREQQAVRERLQLIMESLEHLKITLRNSTTAVIPSIQPSHPLSFHLSTVIKHVVLLFEVKAQKEHVTIQFIDQPEGHVYGNSARFSQVIFNLVSNAIDAYSGTTPYLQRLVLLQLMAHTSSYLITIQDWGEGMSEQKIQQIFELFYSTKASSHSRGIGLYVAKKIIEQEFHGQLRVYSQVGKGTTFTIIIPRAKLNQKLKLSST